MNFFSFICGFFIKYSTIFKKNSPVFLVTKDILWYYNKFGVLGEFWRVLRKFIENSEVFGEKTVLFMKRPLLFGFQFSLLHPS